MKSVCEKTMKEKKASEKPFCNDLYKDRHCLAAANGWILGSSVVLRISLSIQDKRQMKARSVYIIHSVITPPHMKFRADTAGVQESSDLSGRNRLEKPVYSKLKLKLDSEPFYRRLPQSGEESFLKYSTLHS